MIFKHKRTGILYRKLLESFSVERQCKSVIYMGLETGEIFDRDADKFKENFHYLSNPQDSIVPKDSSDQLPLRWKRVKEIFEGPFNIGDVVRDKEGRLHECVAEGTFKSITVVDHEYM